jgi:hypothetical protein
MNLLLNPLVTLIQLILTPTYMEYLDPLGHNLTLKSRWHVVHQALPQ